jgi:hypothetical protein
MNASLTTYFAIALDCSNPVIKALDFAFGHGDVQLVWCLFVTRLNVAKSKMLPGERAHFIWGKTLLHVIFLEYSLDVRFMEYNRTFRYGQANLVEEIHKFCIVLEAFKT